MNSQIVRPATKMVSLEPKASTVPSTISAEAQDYLARASQPVPSWCAPDDIGDTPAWEKFIAVADENMRQMVRHSTLATDVDTRNIVRAGVLVSESRPRNAKGGVILYLHGGAMIMGGGDLTAFWSSGQAASSQRYVVVPDFANPPARPFPAGLEDCAAVYRDLCNTFSPSEIFVLGASGGGNLAVAMLLRLIREGGPPPAGLGLLSPELDASEAGDSFNILRKVDPMLREGLLPLSRLYANGRDLADPEISPLFAEVPASFPPTWIQTGTRDLFLSNGVLFHRALRRRNIPAELHIWEAMPHGGFGGAAPEDREIRTELTRFIDACLDDSAPRALATARTA